MAKNTDNKGKLMPEDKAILDAQKIVPVDINKEMKQSYIAYAMSVIAGRALPDVRDGLKPVHRRILYAMYEDGLTFEKPYRKSATTVGNVLGRYHPHGDASVYDALVRMAQDLSLIHILLVSRLLEGEFLNYNNAIPKDGSVFLTVDVRSFIESVERTGLMISERLKSPLRIRFDSGKVKLSCATAIGTARDEFQAEMEGDPLEIGFNNKFVLDALKNCDEEKVKLRLASPLLPMVITPVEGDKFLFLVLPVRLKNEN